MKSTLTNQQPPTPPNTPKRLKTKPTLILLGILLLGNLFWFVMWLLPSGEKEQGGGEQVAAVDGDVITRQQWLAKMEELYGKETLQHLVNDAVMEKAAKEYEIDVSEEEIDLELALMRSAQDRNDTTLQNLTTEQIRQKLKATLILEKVLAKDIVVKESAIKADYKENQSLYNIPTTYRTSMIVVDSKEQANNVKKELKNGSEFSVLAREKSLDATSASLGGEIGFITADQENVDAAISKVVSSLKVEELSEPVKLSDGNYALVMVSEVIEGESFTYDDVKTHVERQLALEQLPTSLTPETFWTEFDAEWIYDEAK